MSYEPGTHVIATLRSDQPELLHQFETFREKVDQLIAGFHLQKLGEVYHNFSPAGFTGVVCLSESHLSIHTWPEYGRINIDIYLSNFQHNNDGIVRDIYKAITDHFGAVIENEQILRR